MLSVDRCIIVEGDEYSASQKELVLRDQVLAPSTLEAAVHALDKAIIALQAQIEALKLLCHRDELMHIVLAHLIERVAHIEHITIMEQDADSVHSLADVSRDNVRTHTSHILDRMLT